MIRTIVEQLARFATDPNIHVGTLLLEQVPDVREKLYFGQTRYIIVDRSWRVGGANHPAGIPDVQVCYLSVIPESQVYTDND